MRKEYNEATNELAYNKKNLNKFSTYKIECA